MKPFLFTDITYRTDNDVINGREFITETVNEIVKAKYEENQRKTDEMVESAKLPLIVRFLKPFCGVLFFIMLIAILSGESIAKVWESSPAYFFIAPIALIGWITVAILEKKKIKSVVESDEAKVVSEALKQSIDACYETMGVPSDAVGVEVLMSRYKSVGGSTELSGIGSFAFVNLITKMYKKDDMLCFADIEHVYSLPLSSLKSITMKEKKSLLPYWHKGEDISSEKYKGLGISVDSKTGGFYIKSYYILKLEINNEEWGIYFPCYELEAVEAITGIRYSATPATEPATEPAEAKEEAPADTEQVKAQEEEINE